MRGSNDCLICRELGHIVKNCTNRRSQEQGKERVQPNGPSEEAPRMQKFIALKSRGEGEGTSAEVLGA